MYLAQIKTRSLYGISAKEVVVEVHLSNGLPCFNLVGLAETAVKESKDRVRSAIINSGFDFPCRKITVNLAPANVIKSGAGFDLPIALGILIASGQIQNNSMCLDHEFIGELALNGAIRGVPAIIPSILSLKKTNNILIISEENIFEASLTQSKQVLSAKNLNNVCDYLLNKIQLNALPPRPLANNPISHTDWSDVIGQDHAKKALTIAAAGGHNLLMFGPPGSGKTMLAKRFWGILPDLNEEQALETASIMSLANKKQDFTQWHIPPFRAPHHTSSNAALVGGGNPPKPGEISLATNGVLFLDELPEFHKHVIETLRQPLEDKKIAISRASNQIEFPAKFQLIAAMNPCPCGNYGNKNAICVCTADAIRRYLNKLSAPFLDRIDLQINVHEVPKLSLIRQNPTKENQTINIKNIVMNVRNYQYKRQGCLNSDLSIKKLDYVCNLSEELKKYLEQAMGSLNLSVRAYHRLLKVARTIADLNSENNINISSIQLALSYRQSIKTNRS